MKLLTHEVNGFFHFSKPFKLDLTGLPDGLIAIIGPNGAGKTSLGLDAAPACLFGPGKPKAFPSRDGTLYTYATSREAYIDDTWLLDGLGRIRTRVNVDGVKRKTDAILEEFGADGRRYLANPDGLTDSYIDAVKERFPSQRSLLSSAYAAQNRRGGFGDLGQKERMELFVELADLAHYEQRSRTADRAAKAAALISAKLTAALEALRRDASAAVLEATVNRLTAIERERLQTANDRDEAVRQAGVWAEPRKRYAEDAQRHVAASAKVSEVLQAVGRARAALEANAEQLAQLEPEHQAALKQIDKRLGEAVAAIEKRRLAAEGAFEKASKDRQERISGNRKVLNNAEEIKQAVRRVLEIGEEIQGLQAEGELSLKRAENADGQVESRKTMLAAARQAEQELKGVKGRVGLLATVKFGEECGVDPACPLVADAVAAKAKQPGLEALVAEITSLTDGIAHWSGFAKTERQARAGSLQKVETLQKESAKLAPLVAQAPFLTSAEEKIAEYERDGEAAEEAHRTALQQLIVEAQALSDTRDKEAGEAGRALTRKRAALEAKTTALTTELTAEQARHEAIAAEAETTAGAKAELDRIDAELARLAGLVNGAERTLALLDAERVSLEQRRSDILQRMARCAEIERRLRVVEDEMLAWQTLARWCGRDGLQRLEIDAAGPVVSDLANQLLRVGYGARFSVDIVTQVATADGKDTKEKFTILVIDNKHGGEARDIGDLSGGEKVVVEEAVRAALSCYVNLRSRIRFKTLWRDETTGALDPENAPKYIAMLRKLLEMSGAEQVLFITHSPECAALADAQVQVADGQATIALPPYRAAA